MKRLVSSLLVCSLFLNIAPVLHAQDYSGIVSQVKTELLARGVNLSGACGALAITTEVARRTNTKLLRKTGGYRAVPQPDGSCLDGDHSSLPDGYAADYVIDLAHGAVGYDLLGDGGGANIPQWSGPEDDPAMVSRNIQNWREPVMLGASLPPGPTPGPTPTPTPAPIEGSAAAILAHAIVIEQVVADLQARNARIEGLVIAHEAAEAGDRASSRAFEARVGIEWGKVSKYLAIIGGSILAGKFAWPSATK